jgi:hypothetical protein
MRGKQQVTLRAHSLQGKPAAFREDFERAKALRHARVVPPERKASLQASQLMPEESPVRAAM